MPTQFTACSILSYRYQSSRLPPNRITCGDAQPEKFKIEDDQKNQNGRRPNMNLIKQKLN